MKMRKSEVFNGRKVNINGKVGFTAPPGVILKKKKVNGLLH